MRGRKNGLILLAWLIVGIALAVDRNYLEDVNTLKEILSAVLAVTLWPLLLLDINLRVK